MTSPYGPILTGVGLLAGGKLTQSAKDTYLAEVLGLLATGNANGKGGTPTTKIFNALVPLPPVPGPPIPNLTTLSIEDAFWFGPDPLAALMATQLQDPTKCPIWHSIFIDLLYETTAVALDANGSTPLFPLFDVSVAFPNITIFPIPLPDLAIQANILPLPQLMLKLAGLGIQVQLPTIPIPPIPPKLPSLALQLPIPPLILLDLCIGLIKLPFDLLLQLVVPPDIGLVLDLLAFKFDAVFNLAFNIVIQLLIKLDLLLIVPKLFIASLLIYVKDVVAMVITDIVGLLIGAGGALTKAVAGATGLISA